MAGHEEGRRARPRFLVGRAVAAPYDTERCSFVLQKSLARLDRSLEARVLEQRGPLQVLVPARGHDLAADAPHASQVVA